MNLKQYALRFLLVLPLFTLGCATARVVPVEPGEGGQVAVIPKGSDAAREKAIAIMQANCGSRRTKIVREAEEVVGTTSQSNAYANRARGGGLYLNTGTTTRQKTEWRIPSQNIGSPSNMSDLVEFRHCEGVKRLQQSLPFLREKIASSASQARNDAKERMTQTHLAESRFCLS